MDLYNDTLSNRKALFLFPLFSDPSKFQFSVTSYYTLLAIIQSFYFIFTLHILFIAFISFYTHVLFLYTYLLYIFILKKQYFKYHMHCVCFNVVCAAEKWTLTLMVVVPPVILALRWYRQADQFTSSLAYIMSSRPVWAM